MFTVAVNINKQKPLLNWSLEARKENYHTCVTQYTLLIFPGKDTPGISDRK